MAIATAAVSACKEKRQELLDINEQYWIGEKGVAAGVEAAATSVRDVDKLVHDTITEMVMDRRAEVQQKYPRAYQWLTR